MQTISVSIENLCAPCYARCRHCLLCADGQSGGVDATRGMRFAGQFLDWLRANRPELHGMFYMGCCNDFPELREYIRFLKRYSPGIDILQFNGLAMRSDAEIDSLLAILREEGMRGIDLTFYGADEDHDRFAGRKGDYDYCMRLIAGAERHGLAVHAGAAVVQSNMHSFPELFERLKAHDIERYFTFLPHAKGRGWLLEKERLTQADFDTLCDAAKEHFSRVMHKTEAEWLREGIFPAHQKRHLTLALTQENMDALEKSEPAELIAMLESLDNAYYAALPDTEALADAVGRPDNRQLFRWRDLYLVWQKRWWAKRPLTVHNMTDERNHFSIRV